MAMPIEPSGGSEATYGNPSGVGAVYLGESTDPLELWIKNTEAAKKEDEEQRKQEGEKAEKKQKQIADLFKLSNLDYDAPLDTDRDRFVNKSKEIRQYIEDGLRSGIDITQPGSEWNNKLMGMVDEVKLDAKISKYQKEQVSKAIEKSLEKGYNYDQSIERINKYTQLPYEERNKNIGYSDLVVPIKESYIEDADKLINNINQSGLTEKTEKTDIGPFTGLKATKQMPVKELDAVATAHMAANSDKLYADWNKMGKTLQDFYATQQAQTLADKSTPQEIKDIIKDKTPQQYFGFSYFLNRVKSEENIKDLQSQPGAEEAAKQKIDYASGDALYRMIKGFATDNVDYFDNYDKQKGVWLSAPGQPTNELFSTHMSPIIIDMKMIDGNPTPVMATGVKKIRNDVNNIFVRTTENGDWIKMPINTFANKAFVFNYKGGANPVEALNALQYMSKKDGTWTNGIVNFTKSFKPVAGRPAGTMPAEVKGGIATPIKGQEAQSKINVPIKSTASEIGKWSPSNQYEVGNFIYYNEKGTWKKRSK
jgi:hypothetical protein